MKFFQVKQKIARKRLDKKIWTFYTVFVLLITITITGVTLGTSTFMVINNTKEIAAQKIDVINNSVEQELNALAAQGEGLIMNSAVQSFLNTPKGSKDEQLIGEIRSAAQIILNGQPNLKLIEIFQDGGDKLFVRTDLNRYDAHLIVREEYKNAVNAGKYQIKMLYTNKLYKRGLYTLVLYIPIYSTTRLNQQLGVLALSFDCSNLEWAGENNNSKLRFNTYLLNSNNEYFVTTDVNLLDKKAEIANEFNNKNGSKIIGDSLYIYKQVKSWNFYLLGKIPTTYILSDSVEIIILISFLAVFILVIFFVTGFKFVDWVYHPMDEVVKAMDQINETHMNIRLSTELLGEDFEKVVSGFNNMVNRLSIAMETIKEEEHQNQLLRYSALQSQIQPHFLYNTLECIHWQAISLGNIELSSMVKALANYYRIVLSKGKNVIPLEKELEHLYNYVTIQNIRYENIIELEVKINQKYLSYLIPKITLQPLLENSIYHGIRLREGKKGKISIEAYEIENKFIIRIDDNGEEINNEKITELNQSLQIMEESFGYGIQNVNKRIQLTFGNQYGLHYTRSKLSEGGVGVSIILPRIGAERDQDNEKDNYC